jgi:hypothetical protein
MKRLCLILAYLFLFTQTASAMPLLVGQKVVYRGTITGLRISAVDGTAFIDNAGATIPTYADGNHQIEIYDSSNRMLKGVLKAAGSSETYTDMITGDDSTFASDTGFWTKTDASVSITSGVMRCVNTPSHNGIKKTGAAEVYITTGKLYYYGFDLTVSLRNCILYIGGGNDASIYYTTNGTKTGYLTGKSGSSGSGIYVYASGVSATFDVDNLVVREITAPSSSGATIVSAKGGEVYNFSYKNASFTYNAARYYVIIRAIR